MRYNIPEKNLVVLFGKVEKLARRADKLGLPPITISKTGAFTDTPVSFGDVTRYERVFEVEVTGDNPHYAGWNFVATLEHTCEGNVVRAVPGTDDVPVAYRTASPQCDHCRTNRRRNDTFLVCSDAGLYKQVGRNCLRDFLGHDCPQALAEWAEIMVSLGALCSAGESDSFEGGDSDSSLKYFSTDTFLSYAAELILRRGYCSGKQAKEDYSGRTISTASRAIDNMFPPKGLSQSAREKLVRPTDEARELAKNAREWLLTSTEGREDLSEFDHNMRVVAKGDVMEFRTAGIAAYIIEAYRRHQGRLLEAGRSSHVGQVHERLKNLTLTVTKAISCSGAYGPSVLYKLVDAVGNVFMWNTTREALELGVTYTFAAATVKNHGEFNGVPQTVLTRCKLAATAPATA